MCEDDISAIIFIKRTQNPLNILNFHVTTVNSGGFKGIAKGTTTSNRWYLSGMAANTVLSCSHSVSSNCNSRPECREQIRRGGKSSSPARLARSRLLPDELRERRFLEEREPEHLGRKRTNIRGAKVPNSGI